ncbi:MAG: AbrB/MazE/SpoVT family DNA-binding domain-containing protein [Acidobacteriota bacterium]
MPAATVTTKGQVTVPKKIREQLKLRAGDRLDFVEEAGGKITLRKSSISIEELEGILHRPDQKPLSVRQMNKTIRKRFGAET